MLYFKKESLRNPVFGLDKKAVQFEAVPGDTGVIALDESKDGDLIRVLTEHADGRRGGVVRISAEIYDNLKKNAALMPLPKPSLLNQIRTSPSPASFNASPPAAPPAGGKNVGRDAKLRIMDEPGPPSSIAQFRQTGVRSRPVNPQPNK